MATRTCRSHPNSLPCRRNPGGFCAGRADKRGSARRCRSFSGIAERFRGRRCSRFRRAVKGLDVLRPTRVRNRFDRRSPRTPLTGPLAQLGRDRGDAAVRPPVRVARPVARAEPAVGARLLGCPSATRLSRNATVEPRWTKGQRAPNPATHRPSTFAWAPPSRRGPPLTPPTAGRTIPSKRLRGTDSIPAFLRCGRLGRGDADGGEGVGRAGRDGPGSSGQPLPSQEP